MYSMVLCGQDKGNFDLLETDDTWNQEVFHFPIPFAPEIKFEGFEDARFPKFWSSKDSSDFWSYVFVWSINKPVALSADVLENHLEMYFNGLMNYQNSAALFYKNDNPVNGNEYVGKVKTFDALVTKSNISLNVAAEYYYCEHNKRTLFVFRFSPREFGDPIWHKLESVKLRKDYCSRWHSSHNAIPRKLRKVLSVLVSDRY